MIAVLGAGGYVGSSVCAQLAHAGAGEGVRLVVRRTPAHPVPGAEVVHTDLSRPGAVLEAVAGCDVVVDLMSDIAGPGGWRGGADSAGPGTVDVEVMRALADAGGDRAVVYASTAVLNAARNPALPTGAPPTGYAHRKAVAEELLFDAVREGRLRAGCSLRLPSLYGVAAGANPLGRGAVTAMARHAVDRGRLTVWGSGENLRNWLHVQDAAAAVRHAVEHRDVLSGRAWQVGARESEPLNRMVQRIADACGRALGRPPVVVHEPVPTHADAHDLRDAAVDPEAFIAATGWQPVRDPKPAVAEVVRQHLGANTRRDEEPVLDRNEETA